MKERDIVNFDDPTKFAKDDNDNYTDLETGNDVGCTLCYTHEKAYEFFEKRYAENTVDGKPITMEMVVPRCPICNSLLSMDGEMTVVGESNHVDPDAEIGFYHVGSCPHCETVPQFAFIPQQIRWNANHDVYYTGGKDYLVSENLKELKDKIHEKMIPSIRQYLQRKIDEGDSTINDWNIGIWSSYDLEHALAEFLYECGFKK